MLTKIETMLKIKDQIVQYKHEHKSILYVMSSHPRGDFAKVPRVDYLKL